MKMLIPPDWDGQSFCRYAVCWPDSPLWKIILRGLVSEPARGFFWDERTGTVTEVLAGFRQTLDENLHLPEVIMACGDTGLQDIAAALRIIAANNCCNGETPSNGGVQVVVDVGGVPTPVYGSQPPASLPPGEVPPDYPGTVEEYDADKCRTSAALVDGFANTLDNFSYINFAQNVGLTGVILAALAGLITLPAFLIPILIAALIAQVGIGEGLRQLATAVRENKDDLVCALYNAGTTSEAVGRFLFIIGALISGLGVSGPIGVALTVVGQTLMNTDTVNPLFDMSQGAGPEYDCSNCACPEIELDLSDRQFLASYTWEGVATYNSVGSNSDTMVGDELNLTNPTTPNARGIYRWDVANPDNLEFSRVYIPNRAGACCNFFFFVLLEDENGNVINPLFQLVQRFSQAAHLNFKLFKFVRFDRFFGHSFQQ